MMQTQWTRKLRLEALQFEQFRRFDTNMYDAHTDIVEIKEIKQWQDAFPYIRAVGIGYNTSNASMDSNSINAEEWIQHYY